MNENKAKIETDKKGAVPSSCIEITDFDRGMWCVIQIILTTQKDYSLTAELCRNVGFGFNKIKALQEDCGQSFEEEVNDFLKDCSNGGTETCSSLFSNKEVDIGDYSDWEEIDGKHYCPDCYEVKVIDGVYYVKQK